MYLLPNLRFTMYPWSVISNVTDVTHRETGASVRPTMFNLKPVSDQDFKEEWKKCQEVPEHTVPVNIPDETILNAGVSLTLIYHMPTLPQILRSSPKSGAGKKEVIKPWSTINGFSQTTLFDPILFPDSRVFNPKGRVPRVVFIDCRPHLDFHMIFKFEYTIPVKRIICGSTLCPLPNPRDISLRNVLNPTIRMRTATNEGVAGLNNMWKSGELCTGDMGQGPGTRIAKAGSFIGGCVSWMQDWINQKPNTDLMGHDASTFLAGLVETNTQVAFSPPANTQAWWKEAHIAKANHLEDLCLPPLKPFPLTS
jgi:hypothetical protein